MRHPPSHHDDEHRRRWIDRLNWWFTPTSPGDWRRFAQMGVAWVVGFLVVSRLLATLSEADFEVSGFVPIGAYFWVASTWWRMYYQEVAKPASRGADEATLHRWLVRGRATWIAVAYLVVIGLSIAWSSDDTDGDGGSWLALIVFLPLPFVLAWFAAMAGRYLADQYPVRR